MPDFSSVLKCKHPACSLVECRVISWTLTAFDIQDTAEQVEILMNQSQDPDTDQLLARRYGTSLHTSKLAQIVGAVCSVRYGGLYSKKCVQAVLQRVQQNLAAARWYANQC